MSCPLQCSPGHDATHRLSCRSGTYVNRNEASLRENVLHRFHRAARDGAGKVVNTHEPSARHQTFAGHSLGCELPMPLTRTRTDFKVTDVVLEENP
jgi:hypothetical protein